MTAEVILYTGWLTPALCGRYAERWFVFGDNYQRVGRGGQAVIRNCPNALGVATKWAPDMRPDSFFKEGDDVAMEVVQTDLDEVWRRLERGMSVIIPVTPDLQPSLGLERAELPRRAPSIYQAICDEVAEMQRVYPSHHTDVM